MVRKQYRATWKLPYPFAVPFQFVVFKKGHNIIDVQRAVTVQPGVHREKLPFFIVAAKTEKARRLLKWLRIQSLNEIVVTDAAAIHVVIAGERVGCEARIAAAK